MTILQNMLGNNKSNSAPQSDLPNISLIIHGNIKYCQQVPQNNQSVDIALKILLHWI